MSVQTGQDRVNKDVNLPYGTTLHRVKQQRMLGAYFLTDSNLEGIEALVGTQNSSGWIEHSAERIVERQTRIFGP